MDDDSDLMQTAEQRARLMDDISLRHALLRALRDAQAVVRELDRRGKLGQEPRQPPPGPTRRVGRGTRW